MTAIERKTPAEVLVAHRYGMQGYGTPVAYRSHCICGWTKDLATTHRTEIELHSEHVIEALRAESYAVVDMLNDGSRIWVDSETFDEMMSDDAAEPSPHLLAAGAKMRARRGAS